MLEFICLSPIPSPLIAPCIHTLGTTVALPIGGIRCCGRRIAYTWAESPVPGYTQTGIMTEGTTTSITNTRNKVSTLTIFYQFLDGSTAAPTYTDTLAAGIAYDVVSPSVEGYIPVIERVKGTMPGEDVVYIVYYIPKTEDAAPAAGTPFGLGGCPANVGDCME